MASVNDLLLDGQIGHATELKRYSESVVRRIIAVLNRADQAIAAELFAKLMAINPSTFSMIRLESMLYSVRVINREAYAVVERELTAELKDFTAYEASFQRSLLVSAVPVQISIAAVSVDAVATGALARPFQGALLKGWLDDLSDKKAAIIRRTIADGFIQGKTTDAIVREIRGTRAKGYADGAIEITRRDAQAVVRTALSHTAAHAREKTFEANSDLITGYMWLATLDEKTSSPCRLRDSLKYDKTHKPVGHSVPWGAGPGALHWNCRSVSTPILKTLKEITGLDLVDFTPTERASMDGAVPASTNYATWIKGKSAAFQDDVLGPARGKLLRGGGLSLEDLYSAKGSPLTLADLKERHASAFKRAGL